MTESLKNTKEVLGLYVNWLGETEGWFRPSDGVAFWAPRLRDSIGEFLSVVPQRIESVLQETNSQLD